MLGKAVLNKPFFVGECDSSGNALDVDDLSFFDIGSEVEVLKQVEEEGSRDLYVIYCPKNCEATVVYKGFLNFI